MANQDGKNSLYTGAVRVYMPRLTPLVIPELNAFLVLLSHLTEYDQLEVLQQVTQQVSEVVNPPSTITS